MAANIIANVSNIIVRDDGVEYRSIRSLANLLNICKDNIRRAFKKKGKFIYQGHSYYLKAQSSEPNPQTPPCLSEDEYAEYQEFRASKEISSQKSRQGCHEVFSLVGGIVSIANMLF